MTQQEKKFDSSSHRFSMSTKDFIQPAAEVPNRKITDFAVVQTEYLKEYFKNPVATPIKKFAFIPKTEAKMLQDNTVQKEKECCLPSIQEIVLEDFDEKTYNSLSQFSFPAIGELIKNITEDIKQEDFALYSYISYILLQKKEGIEEKDLIDILTKIPIDKINISLDTTDRGVLNMILNTIMFCLRKKVVAKALWSNKNRFQDFVKNLYKILSKTSHYRIKRKITGVFCLLFYYNNDFIIRNFIKFNEMVEKIKLGSVILLKLYQLMKEKQGKIIEYIINNKNVNDDIKAIYYLNILVIFMSVSESELIYDYDKYYELFYFTKTTMVNANIFRLVRALRSKTKYF